MRLVLAAGDRANKFIEQNAPWNLRGPDQAQRLRDVCTIGLNLFRQLAVYLAPVLPKMAEQIGELLGDPITCWEQAQQPLLGTPVGRFQHLMQRVDRKQVDAMLAASAEPAEPAAAPAAVRGQRRRRCVAEPLAAGDHHRRLRQGRPAGLPHPGRRRSARGQEAVEAHSQPGRQPSPHGLRRHQGILQAGGSRRPAYSARPISRRGR